MARISRMSLEIVSASFEMFAASRSTSPVGRRSSKAASSMPLFSTNRLRCEERESRLRNRSRT